MTILKIELQGDVPETPRDKIEALSMFARELCADPAEGADAADFFVLSAPK